MLNQTIEQVQDILPHVIISWNPSQVSCQLETYDSDLLMPGSGLVIRARNYHPQPVLVETPDHFVYVLGSPIIGESIDRPGAVERYLRAEDKPRLLPTVNGEFLLIHLDKSKRVLTVVNDRFASIPLYYVHLDGRFLGSIYYNDLWKALRSAPGFRVHHEAFFEFMYLQRLLGTTTYDHASRFLPPASLFTTDGHTGSVTKYWTPNFEKDRTRTLEECSAELIRRLKTSIRRKTSDRLRYGLFLSGGMDTRTILAAFDPPPLCFTVGFSENTEVRIARRAAQIKGAPHRVISIPHDYYSRYLDELVCLGGGMYVFDHALFFGLKEHVAPHADVVFHGHGMDYLFQGMYLPTQSYRILSHSTYLRRLRPLQEDVVTEYLSTIKFRLKFVDLYRYVRPVFRERLREFLRHSVQQIVEEGRRFAHTPLDLWGYLLIHALSRHYSNCNISDLITSAEQRTLTFENELFDLYLSLPAEMRFAARAMRGAIRAMNPKLASLETANTGMKLDSSPWEQQLYHTVRYLKRVVTGNPAYRHPRAEDRTWPYRDVYLRQQPRLIQAIREASRSEALAAHLPFLDLDVLSHDVEDWLAHPRGGGDLMATLLTIDRFLKQP